MLETFDSQDQLGPVDSGLALNSYQQTDSCSQDAEYQFDGSYEQTDVYQQVDASGLVQDYQQIDTYTSDTTFDPDGNVVEHSMVAAEADMYSQSGGGAYDADGDMAMDNVDADHIHPSDVAGSAIGDMGDVDAGYDNYEEAVDIAGSTGDVGDVGDASVGDMSDACDLDIDFDLEPRRGGGRAAQVLTAVGLAAEVAYMALSLVL